MNILLMTSFAGVIKTFMYMVPVELWGQDKSAVILGHMFCWSGVGSLVGYATIGSYIAH